MDFRLKTKQAVVLAGLFLAALTVVTFYQVKDHDFVNFDDNLYVTGNNRVQAGLTWENIRWAFTTTDANNWHPLTWLSHMLDCQLSGLNPMGPHMNNLLLHLGNAILLFLLLNHMTGALWRPFFVAALFALHPLHVESVAWVAERKDVLSTFLGLLSIWAYVRYVKKSSKGAYGLSLFFYGLCLMSKPMLVTLPLLLLLLDYWPLTRFRFQWPSRNIRKSPLFFAVLEKIPFFAFSSVSSIITLWAQMDGGAVVNALPVKARIANSLISYLHYLGKMIWPQDLAVFYPYPGIGIRSWAPLLAGFALFIITAAVIGLGRRHAYLVTGWLWYLLTLLPVIGLVQVGAQAMADRYTYVPFIGPFIMLAWGIPRLVSEWRCKRVLLGAAAGLVIFLMAASTWLHLQNWQDSTTLFRHALRVTRDNYLAHGNLGEALSLQGKTEEAILHYEEALRINPGHSVSHNNLGLALTNQGKFEEAMAHFRAAIRIRPNFFEAPSNMGLALARQKRYPEAIDHYRKALQINPEFHGARNNLAIALAALGRFEEAIAQFRIEVQARPDSFSANLNLGSVLVQSGKPAEAVPYLRKALEVRPRLPQAHFSLGMAFLAMGDRDSASAQVEILKSMDPALAKRLRTSVQTRATPP